MRHPESSDGTRGGEDPAGTPDLVTAAEPAVAAGGGVAGAPAVPDSTTRTLDKAGVAGPDDGFGGRRARPGPAAFFAPVARAWQRLRPHRAAYQQRASGQVSAEAAASALARLTALPAILVAAWLLPGLPLLLGHGFLPVPMLLISVPLAAALTVNALREVPASWPRSSSARALPSRSWPAWFGLLATVAIVTALIAWQIRESSQSVPVLRSAGTYLQAGYWVAQHGGLPIPQQAAAFGGVHPGLVFASNGFLSRGSSLFPAVTPGMPMLIAAGFWAHGSTGAQAVGPVLGGLAALSFAGLVARLVGPQWAPAGALVLGVSLPQQYISRSTLSETALQVVLFGGLCMLADSLLLRSAAANSTAVVSTAVVSTGGLTPGGLSPGGLSPGGLTPGGLTPGSLTPGGEGHTASDGWATWLRGRVVRARWAAALAPERVLSSLAGLAIGLSLLISLDGLIYLLPAIPFAAVLLISRRPQGVPFLSGFVLGGAYGVAGMFLLDRPFLDTVGGTAAIAGVTAVWLLALALVAWQLARLPAVRAFVPRLLAKIPLRWLPEFGGALAAAVLIGFAIRPYVQTVRGHPSVAMATFIAGLQRAQGLPVDAGRLYSEQSLYWVIWYIGLPTVLLGGVALAVLVRNCLRALITWSDADLRWRIWGLPLAIIAVGTAVVLWQPDIAPDQPWASQRPVVIVLPGLILGACWASYWLSVRARRGGARPATAAVVGLFCTAAMLVPTVATTFGIGISHSGSRGGLKPIAQGLALQRTGLGEATAVSGLCAQLPRNAAVVILSGNVASQFSQVIRGTCGVPVATMTGQPPGAVGTVVNAINASGHRPVLLAASAGRLRDFGGNPVRVLDLITASEPHDLTQLPTKPIKIRFTIWMTRPSPAAVGA